MTDKTKIEWADSTFNPWIGCTRVSPACDNCYAADYARRFGKGHLWQGEREVTSNNNWEMPLLWQRGAAKFCAKHGRKRRVFCASLADVFDNQVPWQWRDDLWSLVRATPDLDWLMLTKRPQNIAGMLPEDWGDDGYRNVWLGTTVEDQERADSRIPALLRVPARIRFLSCEPLLGPVNIQRWLDEIDWVIAGGESGKNARPSRPEWFADLRDQCSDAGVPFFFKQWGNCLPGGLDDIGDGPSGLLALDIDVFGDLDVDAFGNETAAPYYHDGYEYLRFRKNPHSRVLHGRTHEEFPK